MSLTYKRISTNPGVGLIVNLRVIRGFCWAKVDETRVRERREPKRMISFYNMERDSEHLSRVLIGTKEGNR